MLELVALELIEICVTVAPFDAAAVDVEKIADAVAPVIAVPFWSVNVKPPLPSDSTLTAVMAAPDDVYTPTTCTCRWSRG